MIGEHPYVKWAIKAIETYVLSEMKAQPSSDLPEDLFARTAACFVSLHTISGELRGCIGTTEPVYKSLCEEILENAISAATKDPRFPPLSKNELDSIKVNVDILSSLEKTDSASSLNPKIYGVIVKSGWKKGVLLPDLEGVDTVEQQLRIAKLKAGILGNEKIELYRFTVQRYL